MEVDARLSNMVELQLVRRGLSEPRLLNAFRSVPREEFVPPGLEEFAYADAPLPIAEKQTISQPYIVALTVDALGVRESDRVLEIGTGSGYAAAILSKLAKEVYSVERLEALASGARERLARLGYDNVHVLHGDGTLGWAEHAPYDVIAVAAGGPEVPEALLEQLAPGGRLVIPIGADESTQVLTRVTRIGHESYRREPILSVRFVPLIGEQGWPDVARAAPARGLGSGIRGLSRLVRESLEPIESASPAELDALLDRIGDARVVLLGESTHGSSEFYRMRARISRVLIERRGFDFIAIEGDWPDAARVDDYVQGEPARSRVEFTPFARFPQWLWRNREMLELVDWLRDFNVRQARRRVGFHGLDLYSMFTSIAVVLRYLDEVDPAAARVARERYGALTPWQKDPAAYGRAVLVGRYQSSESAVVAMLRELLQQRLQYARADGKRFFDAAQNARLVADAEHYYRAMYYASAASWNLRDGHMFNTLESLLEYYGADSRGIVWEHNSHVGNARATEMSLRGELNVGQLCRERLGARMYSIGLGTDHGTVAAAAQWGDPFQRMRVRPAHADSYERVFHQTGVPAFHLPLRQPRRQELRPELEEPRLERAIGVIYRPETELESHYFYASLPQQFDEFIWFDETRAVEPLAERGAESAAGGAHPLEP
ncbi:MAG TPA: protein-L-isoaspartate(D-aspartate) O-methyltransferase [Polyangiaceae bacterium]|nr:protein-L-isoaspartate(D-aspartate) O-methyltransferase [Polyangiaceae bacterium]